MKTGVRSFATSVIACALAACGGGSGPGPTDAASDQGQADG